jgi:hypothetical protein
VFADHGEDGSGEPLAIQLRPGNAGSNTAADHIEAVRLALAQLPASTRRKILIRADSGGGTREFLAWLARKTAGLLRRVPRDRRRPGRRPRAARLGLDPRPMTPPGKSGPARGSPSSPACCPWTAGRPACASSSARSARTREAQLRFSDIDGHRITCFATSTKRGQIPDLELRHRRRARCEDRIGCAKDTGLRSLPPHGFTQNQAWCELVALACDLLAWTQMLALTGAARWWEPKRLRLRLFSAAGRITRGGRRHWLRLAARWPSTPVITTAIDRLASLAPG